MSRYKSQGTLRYRLVTQDDKACQIIRFTPSEDYSIKHRGKHYAILVSAPQARLMKYKPENHQGIELMVHCTLADRVCSSVLDAAIGRSRVEIEVEVEDTGAGCAGTPELTLVGITLPAE